MVVSRPHRIVRAAVLALALVVLAAQVVWARGAVCAAALGAHAGCKCCEERAREPGPVVAADCCAVEEPSRVAEVRGGVAVAPAPAMADAVMPAAMIVSEAGVVLVRREVTEVEARSAGPPLWLRLRTLRL